jgi:hypothetical protein
MAITKIWKVYGTEGHTQKESYNASYTYDYTDKGHTRRIEVINADKTGSNDYTVIRITRDSAEECEDELKGQLSDGVFENCKVGKIEEVPEVDRAAEEDAAREIIENGLYKAAEMAMDDELREALHRDIAPCSDLVFLSAYMAEHRRKYGAAFTV